MVPPCAESATRAASSPTPPDVSVTWARVEKPCTNSTSRSCSLDGVSPRGDEPQLGCALTRGVQIDARAVVPNADDDACLRAQSLDLDRPRLRFPSREPDAGQLDAVIDRVADAVQDRHVERLGEVGIDPQIGREVADHIHELAEVTRELPSGLGLTVEQ